MSSKETKQSRKLLNDHTELLGQKTVAMRSPESLQELLVYAQAVSS